MTSRTDHPYASLPPEAFWRSAVAERNPLEWANLYVPRFEIAPRTRISTLGSCFAQHLRRQLLARGYNYQDFEPAPPALPEQLRPGFGYELFSARTGNIYTARQLLQLFQEAFGKRAPALAPWAQANGRFIDPLRPSIEPEGAGSAKELRRLRVKQHLAAVRELFLQSEVLVFTLGLTEAWSSRADGTVLPVCPGVAGGRFDAAEHAFHNFSFGEVFADMTALIKAARVRNPALNILLTVSPVPLTATASDQHVLVATTYSKSVLRAVCGELRQRFDFVDYFPSYELVTAPAARGVHYEPNQRSISSAGVRMGMEHFFSAYGNTDAASLAQGTPQPRQADQARDIVRELTVICDDERLDPAAT